MALSLCRQSVIPCPSRHEGLSKKWCEAVMAKEGAVAFGRRNKPLAGLHSAGVGATPRLTLRLTPRQVSAAADASAELATEHRVGEVNKDTFYPTLEAAGDTLVVLDMYTQWCGPCKLLAPKIEALAAECQDVLFVKLDCNQENKSLAKELEVRVVPTFKLYKNKELVGEVKGAKYDALVAEINKFR